MKRLEWLAKNALALLVAFACWRPFRRVRAMARLARAKRVLLVRIDNRVGEALLTTPAIERLAARGFEVHVLLHPKTMRVLEGHPRVAKAWRFEKSLAVLRTLRAQRFEVVVNCGNWDLESVTSAVVARLAGGHSAVVGPANFPSGLLMDLPVPARTDTRSEAAQRAHLVSPLCPGDFAARLSFRETKAVTPPVPSPFAVVNPGGRLDYRRVPPEVFAAAARALVERSITPVITWGPGEEELADAVCAACPGAVRAPPTTLDELASLMRQAKLTVCNNTGPMHLAVAVGCPTLALFFRMETGRWGHDYAPHRMLDVTAAFDARGDVPTLVHDEVAAFASGE